MQKKTGWSDGSVVESTSRGPKFDSQQPHGGSQLSVTPDAQEPNYLFRSQQALNIHGAQTHNMQAKHPST